MAVLLRGERNVHVNESLNSIDKFNRLAWLLYAGLALFCSIIVTMVALDYYADSTLEEITRNEMSNRSLYATIEKLDEVLTMSARMAAAGMKSAPKCR